MVESMFWLGKVYITAIVNSDDDVINAVETIKEAYMKEDMKTVSFEVAVLQERLKSNDKYAAYMTTLVTSLNEEAMA